MKKIKLLVILLFTTIIVASAHSAYIGSITIWEAMLNIVRFLLLFLSGYAFARWEDRHE